MPFALFAAGLVSVFSIAGRQPRCTRRFREYSMKSICHILFAALMVTVLSGWALGQDLEPFPIQQARDFFDSHCQACHGEDLAEADFRVDQLEADFDSPRDRSRWEEVVNVLNSHQMPPPDEPQPDPVRVAELVDQVVQQIRRAERERRRGNVVLRRMNRSEYGNTLQELLGFPVDVSHFPEDASAGGFDNNGQALTLSPLLMELYFQTANRALKHCLVDGDQPPVLKWRIQPESGNSDSHRVEYDGQRMIVNGGKNRTQGDFAILHHESWDRHINFRDFQVPYPGTYRIRIRAAGVIPDREQVVRSAERFYRERRQNDDQQHPDRARYHREAYQQNLDHVRTDPMYDYGPPRLKVTRNLGGQPKVVAEFDVAAPLEEPGEWVFETTFTTEKAGVELEYAYAIPRELENFWFQTSDEFARPEVWVDWIQLEGPIYDQWPPAPHRQLLQSDQVNPQFSDHQAANSHAERILRRVMQKAYRRPISSAELHQQMTLFEQAFQTSQDFKAAIVIPLTATLISPDFLFLNTPHPHPDGGSSPSTACDSYQLATRLSYLLWSGPPDEVLWRLAAEDRLRDPHERRRQVDRMLEDKRSEQFVRNFAGQWLELRQVGANPPVPDLFPRYDRHLEESLIRESEAFFEDILHHDRDARQLIQSDFVVINERLGRYYGIPGVRGDHFRRVKVPQSVPRGGVVTQASVLSITSNGTRTSPVKRGTWIMKNLLGQDPGLPVANAGDIAPKVPGIDKATVRQRLEIHRQLPQCARCHDKIDPLGFALENYNAAGAWRDREGFGYKGRIGENDPLIDATAELTDGTTIEGVRGLQKLLWEHDEQFLACLAGKLYSYALGREMSLADQLEIRQAVDHMKANGRTLRSLLHQIVASEAFEQR